MSDVHTPKLHIPPCAKCGRPSIGGICLEMEPVSPAGQPIMTVEFYCAECRPGDFVTMADRLYPCYRILFMFTASKMKVMRLSREKQEERLRA